MAQQIKIGVTSDTAGAAKGVENVERASDALAESLTGVSRAADAVDKKLDRVIDKAKRATDAAAKLAQVQATLTKALGKGVGPDDARKFSENFERIRSGRGIGSQRLREFDDFGSWYQGVDRTFKRPQDARAHRMRILARGMQGTRFAEENAPIDDGELSGSGGGSGGRGGSFSPGLRRAGSSALGAASGFLAIAGVATTIAGVMSKIGEGVGYAVDESGSLDTLKRRFGGRGIGYNDLQQRIRGSGSGLGISYVDSARFGLRYGAAAGSLDGDIGSHLRNAYGASRSLGLDPGEGVDFFGTMSRLGVAKDDAGQRRLAALIADGIERGGFTAKADEVLRAVADYANTAFRATLSAPNVGSYLAGLTGLTNKTGLDPLSAAGIIGQANSAMMQGGAMGEASKNLSYAALARGFDPLVASEMNAGGLFGTADSVFRNADGSLTLAGQYNADNGIKMPSGGRMNMSAVMAMLKQQTSGRPGLMPLAVQSQFGLSSPQDALGLMWMNDHPAELGGTTDLLKRAGVDINRMKNLSGIADIAKLAGATSMDDLRNPYNDFKGRGDVTDAVKNRIARLHDAGDVEGTRKALASILAEQGQTPTQGSETRAALVDLKDVLTTVGDKLLDPLDKVRDAVVALATRFGSQEYQDQARAQRDAKTDFSKVVADGVSDGHDRLKNIIGAADKDYDDAKKEAGGRPVDVNSLIPDAPTKWDDQFMYAAKMVRLQHLRERYAADNGGASASGYTHHSGEALGERQNNPMNIRAWGTRPVRNGFADFDTAEDGIQAAAKNMLAYRDVDRLSTVGGIIDRLAPLKDGNNPEAYKKFIKEKTGWDRDQRLNEDDPDVMFKLLKSIFNKEQGHDPYSDEFLMDNTQKGISGYYANHPDRLGGTALPDNDPNGTRERAAGSVSVSGSAEIRLVDTSGRPIARATAPLTQGPSTPSAAGTGQ